MHTYEIEIQETLSRVVTVEAASPEEAVRHVSESYQAGNIVLGSEDYVDTDIEVFASGSLSKAKRK